MGISLDDLRAGSVASGEAGPTSDRVAFEHLYRDHAPSVRRVVRRYLWGAVVDDVVQETFTQAFRSGVHLERSDDGAAARRLLGMARNRSIDVLRQRMRGVDEIADDGRIAALAAVACEADPEAGFLAARRRDGIAEALDALCARQRSVLFLRHVEGLSYDEISEREAMSLDGVKSTLARARRSFRHMYASIAERDGLRVVLGGPLFGGMFARLAARLRAARNRMVAGIERAGASLAAASPGAVNTMVAVFVAGSVVVMGAGTAAADEARRDDAAAMARVIDVYDAHAARLEATIVALEARAPSADVSAPLDGLQFRPEVAAATPGVGPVAHEVQADAGTGAVAPVGGVADANASVVANAQADPGEGEAGAGQGHAIDAVTDGLDLSDQHLTEVNAGCHDPDGPVTSVVCPVVGGVDGPGNLPGGP